MIALALAIALLAKSLSLEQQQAAAHSPANNRFYGVVQVQWDVDGTHMTLLAPLTYVDPNGVAWTAPAGMKTDGASIPVYFWSLGLSPYNGKYRDPAVIHDWYCDHRERPYKETHRMFFNAMLANGVDRNEAQLLYFAVLVAGPKWNDQAIYNEKLAERLAKQQSITLLPPPKTALSRIPINRTSFGGEHLTLFVDVPPGKEDDPNWLPDGPIAKSADIWDKATVKRTTDVLPPAKINPEKLKLAVASVKSSVLSASDLEKLADNVTQ